MSNDGARYVASLLSGVTPEALVLGMAQAFLRHQLHTEVEKSQLAIVREDENAYYVSGTDIALIDGIELRVAKDGSTVERV
jgi:hypothetical protein